MIAPLRDLAQRRAALLARSARERADLGLAADPFARRLASADRAVAAVRSHPLITGLAAVAIGLMGPRRLAAWALRLLPLVSALRRL